MDFYNSAQGSDYLKTLLGLGSNQRKTVAKPIPNKRQKILQEANEKVKPNHDKTLVGNQRPPESEPNCFEKVPKTMKRLVRLAISAFYGLEHGIVVDYLIHYPSIREDQLAELLRFDRKHLRTLLAPLKADKIVKYQIRVIISNSGDSKDMDETKSHQNQYVYYYIDYHTSINVIRYKLDKMGETLEKQESSASTRSTFICVSEDETNPCGARYTDLDIQRLFDPSSGEMFCEVCGSTVIIYGDDDEKISNEKMALEESKDDNLNEEENSNDSQQSSSVKSMENKIKSTSASVTTVTTKRDVRKMITLFNTQFEIFFNLLRKMESVILAPHLVKPDPLDLDLNNIINANQPFNPLQSSSSGFGGKPGITDLKSWRNNAMKYKTGSEYEWYKTGGAIAINIENPVYPLHNSNNPGANSMDSLDKEQGKGAPVWLLTTKSNVSVQYRKHMKKLKKFKRKQRNEQSSNKPGRISDNEDDRDDDLENDDIALSDFARRKEIANKIRALKEEIMQLLLKYESIASTQSKSTNPSVLTSSNTTVENNENKMESITTNFAQDANLTDLNIPGSHHVSEPNNIIPNSGYMPPLEEPNQALNYLDMASSNQTHLPPYYHYDEQQTIPIESVDLNISNQHNLLLSSQPEMEAQTILFHNGNHNQEYPSYQFYPNTPQEQPDSEINASLYYINNTSDPLKYPMENLDSNIETEKNRHLIDNLTAFSNNFPPNTHIMNNKDVTQHSFGTFFDNN